MFWSALEVQGLSVGTDLWVSTNHFSAVPASATEAGEVRLWELEP